MSKLAILATALAAHLGFLLPAAAQSADPAIGRNLAETSCSACHRIDAASPPKIANLDAPSFLDISRMPSTTELAIKVFLRTSHNSMPNFILSPEEIDSVAAYIVGLTKK